MRRLVYSIVLLSFGFVAACGGDGGGDNPVNNTDPASDPPQISSVAPNPMVEGQSAVLTGSNFSPTAASNTVTLDNVSLQVTQASATSLTVTIPAGCGPARTTSLRVTAGGVASAAFSVMIAPDPGGGALQNVDIEVGEQVIYRGPRHCFDLPTIGGTAQYLIGIQSTGRSGGATRDVSIQGTVTGVSAPPMPAAAAEAPRPPSISVMPRGLDESAGTRLLQRHRARHDAVRDDLLRPVRNPAVRFASSDARQAPARAVVNGTEVVGDSIVLRVRKLVDGGGCGEIHTDSVTAVLKVKSDRSMWWVDVDNPPNGLTDIQLEGLGDFFDQTIWAGNIAEFGHVNDIDGNGRVVILITKKINEDSSDLGLLLGFVNPCDLFPRDVLFASNEGEFFYAIAPDPDGEVADTLSVESLLEILPIVIVHEFTHIIQESRREAASAPQMASFVSEGQATLAEEIVGNLVLQHDTGENLDVVVAFDPDSTQVYPWYRSQFIDLVYYFGWPGERDVPRIEGTPQECTWIATVEHPCGGRPLWYGVTWSFLRWASDLYGTELGGEPAFQKALIDSGLSGFDNLEQALLSQGTLEDHLAHWAAALYMDDRPGASAQNSMPSWDFLSISEGVVDTAWLNPQERGFINFTETVTIRDPSTAYFLIGGTNQPSYTLRVGAPSGSDLDSDVQVWLVRTQ